MAFIPDERPRSIPELRGMKPIDRKRYVGNPDERQPFSPESYAAQYGIPVEDAEDLCKTASNHQDVERGILALYKRDPELKRRALMLDDDMGMSEEDRRVAERIAQRVGIDLSGARSEEEVTT